MGYIFKVQGSEDSKQGPNYFNQDQQTGRASPKKPKAKKTKKKSD